LTKKIQNELLYKDVLDDLVNSFNYSIITDYKIIVIEENNTIYEIISLNIKNFYSPLILN
jgi:predicted RNA-binding protein with PUA domain